MENLTDDYYEFIGVKREVSSKEIKDACNKLLMKYHPDKCKEVWADGITKRIFEIRIVLLDAEKRKAYDQTLPEKKDKVQGEQIKRESQVRGDKQDKEKERKAREEEKKWKNNSEAKKQSSRKSCDFCGEDITLPFICHKCGGKYCTNHRLPENHMCPFVHQRPPSEEERERVKKQRENVEQKAKEDSERRSSEVKKKQEKRYRSKEDINKVKLSRSKLYKDTLYSSIRLRSIGIIFSGFTFEWILLCIWGWLCTNHFLVNTFAQLVTLLIILGLGILYIKSWNKSIIQFGIGYLFGSISLVLMMIK